MSILQLLHSMCAELPDADLNAIRKARGFSDKETVSRTSYASFYVSSIGVAENIAALTPEETITLRLLHETGEVDISFFERLYPVSNQHGTYSQKYKPIFETVKRNLVRRGLVIMAEIKMRGDTVQLERWRFAMPAEFAPYLPLLTAVRDEKAGLENETSVRRKLLELVGGSPAISHDQMPIRIKHGSLYIKDFPFSLATIAIWQTEAWRNALGAPKPTVPASISPTEAVLKLLSSTDWTNPKTLEPALKIYCFGGMIPPAEKLLKKGWDLGLLSRLDIDSVPHYRLAPVHLPIEPSTPDPASSNKYPGTIYLANRTKWADTTSKPGSLIVDLRLIPFHDLTQLNSLARLAIENNVLLASPSLVKLGQASPAQRRAPLSRWLAENIPSFGKALETVNARWGKTLQHDNLLVACVRDLSLRVQLERELKNNIVILSEQYIAFPKESRPNVEKVLKKTGFVIKTIKP